MVRIRAGVVVIQNKNVALMKRVKNGETYYVLPGGGVEYEETYEQAAKREAFEELGVTVQVDSLFATIEDNGEQYYFTATILAGEFGSGNGREFANSNSGAYQAVWVPLSTINQLTVYPTSIASLLIELQSSERSMISEMSWVGNERTYVDDLNICQVGRVSIGRFGGNSSSGQFKNEDGCLVWTGYDWELSMVLDAHKTAESADLIIKEFKHHRFNLDRILERPVGDAIGALQETILSIFQHEDFRRRCQEVSGETACLIVVRKAKYVWWFSVGDCVLYLFHSELEAFGEYKQNHRSFYEWIGEVNTFDSTVPCYSTGTKELRKGKTILLLTTDGLIECPNTNFFSSSEVARRMKGSSVSEGVRQLLSEVKENEVRDNTTILSWEIDLAENATMPSDS